jgi:hypothetical protein
LIIALTTPTHAYTFADIRPLVQALRQMTYPAAVHARRLPRATYLFCDLDRLSFWELELAGRLYACLRKAGLRVLNDPARVRQRYALLRLLKDCGRNRFNAWLPDHGEAPDAFPVFLRTQAAHRGPLTDLLHSSAEAEAALRNAMAEGYARKDLMFVEYCAEPNAEGVFRKLSCFRIGEATLPSLAVHERNWSAKYGEVGVAGEAGYQDEYAIVKTNRYASTVGPIFELAEVEYGRADFAVVGGEIQTYEINTNPSINVLREHPFALRLEAQRLAWQAMREAFERIDSAPGRSVVVDEPMLGHQRRRDRILPYLRWNP